MDTVLLCDGAKDRCVQRLWELLGGKPNPLWGGERLPGEAESWRPGGRERVFHQSRTLKAWRCARTTWQGYEV